MMKKKYGLIRFSIVQLFTLMIVYFNLNNIFCFL